MFPHPMWGVQPVTLYPCNLSGMYVCGGVVAVKGLLLDTWVNTAENDSSQHRLCRVSSSSGNSRELWVMIEFNSKKAHEF